MNSRFKGITSKKVLRFGIYAVLGAVAVAAILVIGVFYFLVGVYSYGQIRKEIDTPKYQAKMESVIDRVIPSGFILSESKFYQIDIDNNYRLIRTYIVNKPRDVVIDDLLRSLRAQGYSPEEDDYPADGIVEYDARDQFAAFTITIPYKEEPPIQIKVDIEPLVSL
jgi:hypothetical protein